MESTSSYGWYHKTLDSRVELKFNMDAPAAHSDLPPVREIFSAVAILILRCGIVHLVGLGLAVQKQEKSNSIHLAGEGESVVQPKFAAVIQSKGGHVCEND